MSLGRRTGRLVSRRIEAETTVAHQLIGETLMPAEDYDKIKM